MTMAWDKEVTQFRAAILSQAAAARTGNMDIGDTTLYAQGPLKGKLRGAGAW